jgi:pimeloyl-ACP methyl ester carboxylesterase
MTGFKIEVNFERRGEGDPLVLLHGIGHRWQAWEPVIDLLAERHDVIAIDLPGFGASPMLPPGHAYDIPGAIGALAGFFEDLGISRPHLAGNSLGGALSLELASRGFARSVTAFAPAGFWTSADRTWALGLLRAVRASGRTSPAVRNALFQKKIVRMLGGSILFGHPSMVPADVMLADLDSMVGSAGFDAVISGGGNDYAFSSAAPVVSTTVVWGSRDRVLWPRQARRAAGLLPAARHVSLPGCGHVPMADDPERVAELILESCRKSTVDAVA